MGLTFFWKKFLTRNQLLPVVHNDYNSSLSKRYSIRYQLVLLVDWLEHAWMRLRETSMLKRLILQHGKDLRCLAEVGWSHLRTWSHWTKMQNFCIRYFFWDVNKLFCCFSSCSGVPGWSSQFYDFVPQSVRVRIDRPLYFKNLSSLWKISKCIYLSPNIVQWKNKARKPFFSWQNEEHHELSAFTWAVAAGLWGRSIPHVCRTKRQRIDWLIDWFNSTQNPEVTGKWQSVLFWLIDWFNSTQNPKVTGKWQSVIAMRCALEIQRDCHTPLPIWYLITCCITWHVQSVERACWSGRGGGNRRCRNPIAWREGHRARRSMRMIRRSRATDRSQRRSRRSRLAAGRSSRTFLLERQLPAAR